MLNQYAVDNPTLPVNQCLSQLVRDPGGMLSRFFRMPSRKNGPPSIWDTHGILGNFFCNSNGVFFSNLSTRIASMEFIDRGAASVIFSGKD